MKSLIKKTFSALMLGLNCVLPIKKNIIIFSQAKSRYSGNSRVMFEYLVDNGFDVFWLYTDDIQKNKISKNYEAHLIKIKSLKAISVVMQARYFIISYSGSDLGYLWHIAKNNTVLNLWHGICIKNIGLIDEKFSSQVSKTFIRDETSYYTYMTASSDIDRYVTCVSHGLNVKSVLSTGNPRTDRYLRNLKALNNDTARFIKILYAPTFRDYELDINLFFPFPDFDCENLQSFFSQNSNIKIYLRPHPSDLQSNQQAKSLEDQFPDNIIYYSQLVCDDVDEQIEQFNVVITDYSSIYIEPLLADTPCIFIPFDYDRYIKKRGLAYNYDLVTPGPKVTSFRAMLNSLESAVNGAPDWRLRRSLVVDMFFKYKDDGACQRIAEQILGFKNKKL
ncbi:CDP-glycerol glycerophosphotransferase family protein [Pseudomonadales bacterium]|nr:CDP-glycerol glycerophosphotransferase family protein [Pseudomonadales bacterium]